MILSADDLPSLLDDYLKSDLLPRDRRYLMQVVFECDLHTCLRSARSDATLRPHLEMIWNKLKGQSVEESESSAKGDDIEAVAGQSVECSSNGQARRELAKASEQGKPYWVACHVPIDHPPWWPAGGANPNPSPNLGP